MKRIRGHPYLYFWAYEARSWGSQRTWTYVGRVGRGPTRAKAAKLLIDYHLKVRREVDRRVERLAALYAAWQ